MRNVCAGPFSWRPAAINLLPLRSKTFACSLSGLISKLWDADLGLVPAWQLDGIGDRPETLSNARLRAAWARNTHVADCPTATAICRYRPGPREPRERRAWNVARRS
jgi:hypothetical protein